MVPEMATVPEVAEVVEIKIIKIETIKTKVKVRVTVAREDPVIVQTHLIAVVTAIISLVPKLGSV